MKGVEFFQRVSIKPPFSKMHPKVALFFKQYLANEKVIAFNGRHVVNTHFPPFPSPAFDSMAEHFDRLGAVRDRKLFSVTLAVTNRCGYDCWHCYNAGRSQEDIPYSELKRLIEELQEMGVVHVTLTGGEPLLRTDLEDIASLFDDRTYLTLNTTGSGLTAGRAAALQESGVFAIGVSLDSIYPEEHDRMRGKKGAFDTSLEALRVASAHGLYPYIISVATHDFLRPERFHPFMNFAAESGALEVHLLEPSPTGKLAGNTNVLLSPDDKSLILDYQKMYADEANSPILSSFSYLESGKAFGCGAGLTHLYIDGCGDVSPCNLVPLSFGNVTRESLPRILERMGGHFQKPRSVCVGKVLSKRIKSENLPLDVDTSINLCKRHLPEEHAVPEFFRVRAEACEEVGRKEIQSAYDRINGYYDEYWLSEAGRPINDLLDEMDLDDCEAVFEAGCGTGYATALIADRVKRKALITAADISDGMLDVARRRLRNGKPGRVRFVKGDALELLGSEEHYDLIFSSWVLGYIPMKEFFMKASRALKQKGAVAFIVHKEDSPRIPMQIFRELVAADPSMLTKKISFDFPRDIDHVKNGLSSAGLMVKNIVEGDVTFAFDTPEDALRHLLKSGAGTAFHDAIDPSRRKTLEQRFLDILAERKGPSNRYEVVHDYIACVAGRE